MSGANSSNGHDRLSVAAVVTYVALGQFSFVIISTFVLTAWLAEAHRKGLPVQVDPLMAGILGTVVAAVISLVSAVVGYWTGSSVAAKASGDALAQLAGAGPQPPASPMSAELVDPAPEDAGELPPDQRL